MPQPQERFDAFYPTVCHICKDPSYADSLKKCQGCKLISYCSVDHQRSHWSEHRSFCKAVQRLVKDLNIKHIFENDAATLSSKNWCALRIKMKWLIEVILKRSLSTCETEMLHFPSMCQFCGKIDPGNSQVCCNCQCVTYCSDKHLREDAKLHNKDCKELKLGFDLDMAMFHGNLPDINLEFGGRYLCHSSENFFVEFIKFASVSNVLSNHVVTSIYFTTLSCPLTFIYTVFKTGLHLSKKLIVHLIGANNFEIQHLPMWEIVFHWLPTLKQLHLILVGPEVYPTCEFTICSDCKQGGCKLMLEFCPGELYHNYSTSKEFTSPDLILIYNCGLSEFIGGEEDTWQRSIPCIMASNCPVMITSYTAREAECDLSRLRNFDNETKVLIECQKNVFSARKPVRDWEQFSPHSDSLVFYHNAFMSVTVPKTWNLS